MQELLKLFQKIEVIESTKQTKPGSIGYISYIGDIGAGNAARIKAVFTRFGKSGKKRFSTAQIKTPLIDIDRLQISGANKKKTIEDLRYRELRHFRPPGSRIKVIQESSKDLTNIDTWDFMAYISAISLFLSIYSHYNSRARNMNEANIDVVRPNNIGKLICDTFRSAAPHPELEEYITYFDRTDTRKMWLDVLRKEISVHKQVIARTNTYIASKYESGYEYIKQIAKDNGIAIKKLPKWYSH